MEGVIDLVILLEINGGRIHNFHSSTNFDQMELKKLIVDFQQLLQTTTGENKDQGIIYSKQNESFFDVRYIKNISSHRNYLLLTNLPLEYAIQYYYKQIDISKVFNTIFDQTNYSKFTENSEVITSVLETWKQEFKKLFNTIINPFSQEFYQADFVQLINIFDGKIAELIYALLLEIPIIFENISREGITEISRILERFVPYYRITQIRSDSNSLQQPLHSHIVYSEENLDKSSFDQYFSLDYESKVIVFISDDLIPNTFTRIVQNAVIAHEDELMPFYTNIRVKVISIIEKIFVSLIMNGGEINFDNYLHPEERDMKPIYNSIFDKIVFQGYRIVP